MIRLLAIIIAIGPIVGVSIAYWLNLQHLPSCMPFLDGCTSISSTGRYAPGDRAFRAALLPQAAFLAMFWWLVGEWLAGTSGKSARRWILACGIVGAASLIVYVTFLGTSTPIYEFMRRFGIYGYFLGTVLAQLLATLAIEPSTRRRAMLGAVVAPFALGFLNLLQKALLANSDRIENSIEWIAALAMQAWFLLLLFEWRARDLRITVRTDQTSARR